VDSLRGRGEAVVGGFDCASHFVKDSLCVEIMMITSMIGQRVQRV